MSERVSVFAKEYRSLKNRLFFTSLALDFLFFGLFFFSGFSLYLREQAASLFVQIFWVNGFYIMVFGIFFYFFNFPLNFYEGYILEHKFKLSNQNFFNWLKDNLKKAVLDFVLAVITVEAVYFFLKGSPNYWWVFFGLFWIFLTLILAKIAPLIIIPLFYKYLPITNFQLKQRIFGLFDKCSIKIKNVCSIDFSRKTKKANAFICGLGKNRRVVLSDTLLENFSSEEIEQVVAHELSHYRNQDILKLIFLNSGVMFIAFYLLDKLLKNLFFSFGLKRIDDIAFFPILAMGLILLGFITLPLVNSFSRYLERKADLFCLKLTQNKQGFISMIEKLGKINLADFFPSRFIEVWLYDHPPIGKRIKSAENFLKPGA